MKNRVYVIISIIAIILIVLITYKVIGQNTVIPEPEIEEHSVSDSEYINKQKLILDGIVTNFNSKELIGKYIDVNTLVEATSEGNTITVKYKDNAMNDEFKFVLDEEDDLNIVVEDSKESYFINIFKLMVTANQKRLGNNNDLTSFFEKLNKGSHMLTPSTFMSKHDGYISYVIHVNKKIDGIRGEE